ncbi:hypothetical protein VTI74DRAFT_9553 [Chaetomium olivicolor]
MINSSNLPLCRVNGELPGVYSYTLIWPLRARELNGHHSSCTPSTSCIPGEHEQWLVRAGPTAHLVSGPSTSRSLLRAVLSTWDKPGRFSRLENDVIDHRGVCQKSLGHPARLSRRLNSVKIYSVVVRG